jgi:hypothetical protein
MEEHTDLDTSLDSSLVPLTSGTTTLSLGRAVLFGTSVVVFVGSAILARPG